ncbi:MAG: hypothetical protein LBQ34_04920 [Alphaproteobacteria bacterium]|jgi:ABC-type phosphate transport system auxiliary subunit|nr:hypothetical protein [Alphaproteobacteria bacterium]
MNVMSVKLFEYLKKAGIPEDLAQKTSIELPESLSENKGYSIDTIDKKFLEQDNKINKLDLEQTNKIDRLESKLVNRMDRLDNKIDSLATEMRTKFNLMISISLMTITAVIATLVSIIFK